MGWDIKIKTDKPMTEAVIEEIIPELPDIIRDGAGKMDWGWSLAVDVGLRNDRTIALHGSYGMSGHLAQQAAESFSIALKKRGFNVTVGEIT